MVRFSFSMRQGIMLELYCELEKIVNKYEFRYGVFHGGASHGEIITSRKGRFEVQEVLKKFDIRYELENVL